MGQVGLPGHGRLKGTEFFGGGFLKDCFLGTALLQANRLWVA